MKFLAEILLCLLISLVGVSCSSLRPATTTKEPVHNPWMQVESPAVAAYAQAIGNHSAGCLLGAAELPLRGAGYKILDPLRHRNYGHPELIFFIERYVHAATKYSFSPVLVGDMAMARGGPFTNGHSSHQTGLDVDLFWHGHGVSVVQPEKQQMDLNQWSDLQRRAMQWLATDAAVERIFVDPLVKKDLCHWAANKPEAALWLRKLRPWWRHHDHAHVRLKCLSDNSQCKPQDPLPEGDGCDATLDWWFTLEAQELPGGPQQKTFSSEPWAMPVLPEACSGVLNHGLL